MNGNCENTSLHSNGDFISTPTTLMHKWNKMKTITISSQGIFLVNSQSIILKVIKIQQEIFITSSSIC